MWKYTSEVTRGFTLSSGFGGRTGSFMSKSNVEFERGRTSGKAKRWYAFLKDKNEGTISRAVRVPAFYRTKVAVGKRVAGNNEGILHDASDFHYPDGTQPPVTLKQLKWMSMREKEQERIEQLAKEMKEDIEKGNFTQFF